jgi:hypothetical protein
MKHLLKLFQRAQCQMDLFWPLASAGRVHLSIVLALGVIFVHQLNN